MVPITPTHRERLDAESERGPSSLERAAVVAFRAVPPTVPFPLGDDVLAGLDALELSTATWTAVLREDTQRVWREAIDACRMRVVRAGGQATPEAEHALQMAWRLVVAEARRTISVIESTMDVVDGHASPARVAVTDVLKPRGERTRQE